MSGKKKGYMFHDENTITKYKRTELKKMLADNVTQEMQDARDIGHSSDDINVDDLRSYQPIGQQALEIEEITMNEPLSTESSNLSIIESHENAEHSYDELFRSNEDLVSNMEREVQSRFVNLLEEKTFFQTLSLNVSKSPAELLLMSLKFTVSSKLSLSNLSNLIKFVNLVCETTVLPETRYGINQICSNVDVTFYSICPQCTNYIGTFEDHIETKICDNCNGIVNVSNPSDPCFFAMIDPSEAICNLIKNHEKYYDYIVKKRQHEENHIKDIYDGELYRKFVRSLPECDKQSYVTVIFNTDGAPVFKSSKFSLWPIYIILNEIPPQSRMNSAITVGLWCGNVKPEMSVFLDIFVKVMNKFSAIGINCRISNENRRLKIFALLACVDTQARPSMNGSSHFNANYGCDWCLHEGQYYAGSMRYPFRLSLERDHNTTVQHATEAVASGVRVFGMVSASPLLNLYKFDIIEGFTPDYMHCCLAGVAKQFTDNILRHLTKTQIEYVNVLLNNIRAPNQIGCLSRSLEHKGQWKAREYENWALYYSVPILSIVMNNNIILKHWCLFIDALHIFLKMDITFSELNHANELLHEFASISVYNWGPLYAHSTFPFEAANHNLLTSIHCAKGVILQIVKYQNIQHCITILENQIYDDCPTNVIQYCQQLGETHAKHSYKISNVTYLGKQGIIEQKYVEKFNICRTAKVYNKTVLKGCLFMTKHKENKRSCNYYAQLNDERFIQIITFIIDEQNTEITVCKVIKVRQHRHSSTTFHVLDFSEEIIIKTNKIWRSCVYIELENERFIVPVPNILHY